MFRLTLFITLSLTLFTSGSVAKDENIPANCDENTCKGDPKAKQAIADLDKVKELTPPDRGYDLNAPAKDFVKASLNSNNECKTDFSGSKTMCTLATHAVLVDQICDLINLQSANNSGPAIDKQNIVKMLNSRQLRNGMNGNTYAPGYVIASLGGQVESAQGENSIRQLLEKAKPGDILTYATGTGGHATTFRCFDGSKVCFFSSQKRTNGIGFACTPIGMLKVVSVGRLPDIKTISENSSKVTESGILGDMMFTNQMSESKYPKHEKIFNQPNYSNKYIDSYSSEQAQ